jgi:hypothetical protein
MTAHVPHAGDACTYLARFAHHQGGDVAGVVHDLAGAELGHSMLTLVRWRWRSRGHRLDRQLHDLGGAGDQHGLPGLCCARVEGQRRGRLH